MLFESSERPFRALPIFLCLGVLDEIFGMLINTKISEMNESLSDIFGSHVVFVGGKPCQSLFEHVNSQRVIASYNNVDSKIVFEVVYQVRIIYVLRDQIVFFVTNISVLSHHLYSSSASLVGRLHYP